MLSLTMFRPTSLADAVQILLLVVLVVLAGAGIWYLLIWADRKRARRAIEERIGPDGRVLSVRFAKISLMGPFNLGGLYDVSYLDASGTPHRARCLCTYLRCIVLRDEPEPATA